MKPSGFANDVSKAVIAYCEAIDVPSFDEAAITSPHRLRANQTTRSYSWPRLATYAAALAALLLVVGNVPAVVARVRLVFAAFTVASGGRTMPMTIREVSLERVRADMPFTVIAPPPIEGAPIVAIDEVYAGGSRADASVIFEIHGRAPGPEVMIVESSAARPHTATLFALGEPAQATLSARLRSLEPLAPSGRHEPRVVLRGVINGSTFAPASWVTRGTRVAVMMPPGFLSPAQFRTIQRAMSR